MPITSVLATSNKVPGSYIEVQFGVGQASAGDAPRKVCLVGHKLASGTATADVPVQVFSVDDAKTLFGQGSELHRMCRAAFRVHPSITLWCVPITPPVSVAATGTFVLTGTATAAGTYNVYVEGELIQVAIAAGDTAAVAAGLVRDAINDQSDWPVTAGLATATVTATARHHGTRGNNISFRTSGTVAGLTATHASGFLTGGTGTDTLTNARAAMASERFHLIAPAQDTSAELQAWRTHVNDNALPVEGRRQQLVGATNVALASAITIATALNAARCQVAWHYNADDPPAQVAAAVAAGRALLEEADPAAPMSQSHGTVLSGLRPQVSSADRPLNTELISALNNGVTPLSMDDAGNVYICRSITSRSQDSQSNPNYATLDTSKVTAPDFLADDLQVWWSGFVQVNGKVAPDDPDGNPPDPGVATPLMIKDGIYGRIKALEPNVFVNVDANLPSLIVELAETPDGRVNALIPVDVVEGAYQFAAAVQQIG